MLAKIKHLLRKRTKGERIILATQAALWLDDDSLNTALASIRDRTYSSWFRSKDPEARERAWLMMHAINQLTEALTIQVDSLKFDSPSADADEDL